MCISYSDTTMLNWLETQVRVLEAWREDIAARPAIDMRMVMSLENHYQWLTSEVRRLSDNEMNQGLHPLRA
jgi:hypothetical protein